MAYNRENFLRKVIEIKDIMSEHQRRGVSQIWVYNNLIKDRYFISLSTFNNYLAIPAKRILRELQEKQNYEQRQKSLFDETEFTKESDAQPFIQD